MFEVTRPLRIIPGVRVSATIIERHQASAHAGPNEPAAGKAMSSA